MCLIGSSEIVNASFLDLNLPMGISYKHYFVGHSNQKTVWCYYEWSHLGRQIKMLTGAFNWLHLFLMMIIMIVSHNIFFFLSRITRESYDSDNHKLTFLSDLKGWTYQFSSFSILGFLLLLYHFESKATCANLVQD